MGMGRPMGFGYGGPRIKNKKRFAPFAKQDSLAVKLIAGPADGVFGTYW